MTRLVGLALALSDLAPAGHVRLLPREGRPEPPNDTFFFKSSVATLASVADDLIAIKYPIAFGKLGPGPHLLTIEATVGTTTLRRDVRFAIQ